MNKFIVFALALTLITGTVAPSVTYAQSESNSSASVATDLNAWINTIVNETVRQVLGSESLNQFIRTTVNTSLQQLTTTNGVIITASTTPVLLPPNTNVPYRPLVSSTTPCAIPPVPGAGSMPYIYKDGKVKIISSGNSYIYKDGKHKIVSTPGAYIEKNGKEKIVITPGASIYKNGSLKQIIPCDGNYGTTTPPVADTTAPTISSLGASSVQAASALVTWKTNEYATGRIFLSTSTPVVPASATTQSHSGLTLVHSLFVSGLTASTTYYYVVESKDASGNTATSSVQSFTTLASNDTTAPTISGISFSGITASGVTVNWTTNESATSKVYYGTSTPLALGTAFAASNNTLKTNHALSLSGLASSTVHYVVIESKDGAGNTAQSATIAFVTLP